MFWVKVENTGKNDAQNTKFQLDLPYPFSSSDNFSSKLRDLILGTVNAYKDKKANEVKCAGKSSCFKI